MSMSLREQLLAAGFGKKKAAEQAERKAKEQQRDRAGSSSPSGPDQAAKAARAQALQQRRQEEADRKERWTQIKLLIEQHRLPKVESDDYFNFVSRGKVRRLAVDAQLRERIIRRRARDRAVRRQARCRAARYRRNAFADTTRAPSLLCRMRPSEPPSEDDPYKDYVVPDDLKW